MFIDLLIKIIVFLLPTQLGLHFWPNFSRVAGLKIDYLSPTLYFVDILLLILIIFSLREIIMVIKNNRYLLASFVIFATVNTLFSISPLNSLFWWLRLSLYLLFFIVLKSKKISWKDIEFSLLLSTSFVVLLAIFQTVKQSSVGGLFYWFGERSFSSITPGLARLNLFGHEHLRASSTFSHPNSFSGYLLIVFYLFRRFGKRSWYSFIPFIGIVLSLSKIVIFSVLLLLLNIPPVTFVSFFFILTLVQPLNTFIQFTWQPLSDRLFYYSYLPRIVNQHRLFGTGLGNFIPALGDILPGSFLIPSKLQPIHNLAYLYFTELGIFGFISMFIAFLDKKVLKYFSRSDILTLFGLVLLTGAFDHYSWTLPQNKLILILALALMH